MKNKDIPRSHNDKVVTKIEIIAAKYVLKLATDTAANLIASSCSLGTDGSTKYKKDKKHKHERDEHEHDEKHEEKGDEEDKSPKSEKKPEPPPPPAERQLTLSDVTNFLFAESKARREKRRDDLLAKMF